MNGKVINVVLLLVLILTTCFSNNTFVKAHELKENNDSYAILHVEPKDNPDAGAPSTLLFYFGTKQGIFDLNDCDCNVIVKDNNKMLQQAKIVPAYTGSTTQGSASFIFPHTGTYQIIATGSSTGHRFVNFTLIYSVTAASSVIKSSITVSPWHVAIPLAIGLLCIMLLLTIGVLIKKKLIKKQAPN